MEHRDVVVVGAGPAGSTCARALKLAGLDVLVLDRQTFPRDKTCAGWITPEVLDALELSPEQYGRTGVIEPISTFRVGIIGGNAVDVPFGRPVSYAIRRAEFDGFLMERARADFRQATHVRSLSREGRVWVIDGQITTPVVVGAGGTHCPVSRLLNAHAEPGTFVATQEAEVEIDPQWESSNRPGVPEFYFTPDFSGYGWIIRKGRFATVGFGGRDARRVHDDLRSFTEFLQKAGRSPDLRSASWRGHSYVLRGVGTRRVVVDGALLVGDAGGFACATSGEGIRPAVESALVAAGVIIEAAGDYGLGRLDDYRVRVEQRLAWAKSDRGARALLPRKLEHALGRRLVTVPWFARRVVLDQWFLHR